MLREAPETDEGEIPSLTSPASSRKEGGTNVKSRPPGPTSNMRRVRELREKAHELLQHDIPLHQIPGVQVERNV